MRMSHEIFNMEWSNTDSIYLHTRDGLLYSAFAGSAERLFKFRAWFTGEQGILVRARISGRSFCPCKKDFRVFPRKLHFY